jgi:hypothetical protein
MPKLKKIEEDGYIKFDTLISKGIADIRSIIRDLYFNMVLRGDSIICCPHFINYKYIVLMSVLNPCLHFLRGYELTPINEVSINPNYQNQKVDFWHSQPKVKAYPPLQILFYSHNTLPSGTQKIILEINHNSRRSNIIWRPGEILVCPTYTDYKIISQITPKKNLFVKQILIHSETAHQSNSLEMVTQAIRNCEHKNWARINDRPISIETRPYSNKCNSLGVFTIKPICKGDLILTEKLGRDYPVKSRQDIMKSCFANHAEEVNKNQYIINFSIASFINHSCQPNTEIIIDEPFERKVVASEEIPSEREITIDYTLTSVSEYGQDDSWQFDCQCGSLNCRNKVNGDILKHPILIPIALKRSGIYVKSKIAELLKSQ